MKNSLKDTGVSYRGVNINVTASDGFVFELQFHTPNKNHKPYEEQRASDDPTRIAQLDVLMTEVADKIPMLPGIQEAR